MSQEVEELKSKLAKVQLELDNTQAERRRLAQLLQQQPDLKRLDETQAMLQAAEVARQHGGRLTLGNQPEGGVLAELWLPTA